MACSGSTTARSWRSSSSRPTPSHHLLRQQDSDDEDTGDEASYDGALQPDSPDLPAADPPTGRGHSARRRLDQTDRGAAAHTGPEPRQAQLCQAQLRHNRLIRLRAW